MIEQVNKVKNTEEKTFPKLMLCRMTNIIVLMAENGHGTIIVANEELERVGKYSTSFIMGRFVDYNEEITIKNK